MNKYRKITISEERLLQVVHKFLSDFIPKKNICDIEVDFNTKYGRIVVKLYFSNWTTEDEEYNIQEETLEQIQNYFGVTPWLYTYRDSC